jgi:hypothetical protein
MEVVDVRYIGSDDQYQAYAPADVSLINTVSIVGTYGAPNDYIEYFIKDLGNVVLSSNYYATQYTIGSVVDPVTGTTTQLYLDPESDARAEGYNRGIVNIKYNFFAKQLLSAPDPSQNFWIKEVSTSRTEIKVARQDLSNTQLSNAFNEFNAVLSADAYYPTFYLNFGADVQIIAVNAVYVEEEGSGYVIFKLYEPLPTQFDIKSTFWVVTQVADSAEFNVSINVAPEAIIDSIPIKGANFKVGVKDKVGQTTPYYNYTSLLTTSVTSSYQQLQSMMQEKGIQINVDYSNFSNFIHFSSATERLDNFVYKVQQIESASAGLAQTNTSTAKVLLQNQIDSTITNFDGYEYYLYFNSGSTSWPKKTATQPYILYSATSSQVTNWLGSIGNVPTATTMSMYWSSSYYDNLNKDLLLHATPTYILDDNANAPYLTFLNMIGQHFDNIWIYLKDVTNHYSAENNPFVGISMDQVADALRSFGVQLYTNTSITDNIYYSLLGINQTGSALPVTSSLYSTSNIASSSIYPLAGQPYLTSSLLLPPFGDEKINRYVITFVTGSGGKAFQTLPNSQITGETYKRLYHNLAYLLKTRGTERGVKALITTFGIPGNILTPHEYGGYDIYKTPGIQEISNTKIITGSILQLSSSLLSPFTTLQYYQNNTDKSSNDVEVAFSPADSINANITSSGYITSSTQPGYFNIMQYIGAPNLQYSSSYIPLVQLGDNYFSKTYTQRYNVWDFIRVIKYYNNSLFKMVRDWVPARTSAISGIVIQSHILERNKYARHEPTVIFEDQVTKIGMVSVTGSTPSGYLYNTSYTASIPIQYNSAFNYLASSSGFVTVVSNTGVENYNGQYSGSYIQVTDNVFSQIGISSYNYPWTSSVSTSGNQDILFTTYSLNYLLNNVTSSVLSQRFLELDYNNNQIIPTNYGLVTQSLSQSIIIGPYSQSLQPYSQYSQIQDYNYFLRRSTMPRYSGSILSGLYYNVYTPQNATYSGDISLGSNPVINYYTNKLGLFTQIQSSSFIPGAVNASLAYQADVSGGLSELNQNNKNWQDIQNIFVAGETLTIKQFDNKKYSNQVATDGIKTIYNSGYNYTPEIYFQTGVDNTLYFQYTGNPDVSNFVASLTGGGVSNYYISGTTSPTYPVTSLTNTVTRAGSVYKIFDTASPSTYFSLGNATNFPSYSAPQAAQKQFNYNIGITFQFTDPSISLTSGSYDFGAYLDGSTLIGVSQSVNFTSSYTAASTSPGAISSPGRADSDAGYTLLTSYGTYTGPFSINGGASTGDATSTITVNVYSWTLSGVAQNGPLVASTSGTAVTGIISLPNSKPTRITSIQSATPIPASSISTSTKYITYTTPATSIGANQPVVFKLTQGGMSSANYTASLLSNSSLTSDTIAVGAGGYPYATSSYGNFIQAITNLDGNYSSITLTSNLGNFENYQFVPYFVSASVIYSSSLYSKYGDINTTFSPKYGDKVILSDTAGITQDLDVYSFSNNTITVVGDILTNWCTNPKLVKNFLLLRKYQDEQNVIVTFNKPPGQTSYGFLIPNTLNPQVTNNINVLQAAVQSQLLSTQTATTTQ